MGKSLVLSVLMFGVLLVAATSRSDSGAPDPAPTQTPSLPNAAAEEPITGSPAVSAPGDSRPRHDPFKPYDIGPPGTKTWSYNDLSSAEKAYADRNRNPGKWAQIGAAYAHAATDRAHNAAGAAAAHQLGVGNLGATGVVP